MSQSKKRHSFWDGGGIWLCLVSIFLKFLLYQFFGRMREALNINK